MLRQRIVTALLLLAVLVPALFAGPRWPFTLIALLMIGAAGWEWARLNGQGHSASLVWGGALALACAFAAVAGWVEQPARPVWWLTALAWIAGGSAALRAGPSHWLRLPAGARLGIGLALLGAGWLAIVQSRAVGINFILSVLCLVWMADVAAYFGGRAFGRRKLAPGISPGKSWEGVWSGVFGVALLALVWSMVERGSGVDSTSLFVALFDRIGHAAGVLVLVGLAAMSVVGDLVESLVKRAVGVKDSSGLLPGHGGVLDRIDALLPVFPIALAVVTL